MSGWKITRQDYLDFFRKADQNRDCYISMNELKAVLRSHDYKGHDADINVMFHSSDTDCDNLISLSDFWVAMGQHPSCRHVLDLFVRVFRRNNENKDGVVTEPEFHRAMKDLEPHLTKDEFQRLYRMIPPKDRTNFNYLQFKAHIQAVWENMDRYDEFWIRADQDADNLITKKELEGVLLKEGYTQKDVDKKCKEMAKSSNDKITYEDYISVMADMPVSFHKAAFLRKSFEKFDFDKSGTISKQELKVALANLGQAFSDRQLKDIMDKADSDGSGELDYDEFVESIEEILEQEDAYHKFFREADVDDSGYLSIDELIKALRKGGYKGTDEQIRKMFHATDGSVDQKISFDEYMQCMGKNPVAKYKEVYMRRIFNELDENGDGILDKKELEKAFKEMGRVMSSKEVERIMKIADKDGSGSLDYEEFIMACFEK